MKRRAQCTFLPLSKLQTWVENAMQESMQCTDNGTLRVLSKSLQEYKFNAEGMSRGNSGLMRSDQPYKVSSNQPDDACLHKAACTALLSTCQII